MVEDSSRKRQGKKRLQGSSFYFKGFLQQDYLMNQRLKHPISDIIEECRLTATKADQAEPGAKTGVTVWNLDKKPAGTICPPSDSTPRNTLESGFNILGRGKTNKVQTHRWQQRNWDTSGKRTTKRLSSNTNLTEQRLGKKLEERRKEAKRRGKSYSIWRERKTMAKGKKSN